MSRSVEEIKMRCKTILNNPKIIFLVQQSNSPTSAYDMVYFETKSISDAKAGRWLAVLRRDHVKEYENLLNSNQATSKRHGTEGERHEENDHE